MVKNTPDYILFDFDGTLCSLPRSFLSATDMAFRLHALLKKGRKPHAKKEPAEEAAKKSVKYAFARAVLRPRLMAGLREFLESLETQNIEKGIVSNGPQQWANPLLERFGLSKHFSVSSFKDAGMPYKPSPVPITSTIEKMQTETSMKPKVIWYVGDRVTDVMAALKAGIVPVAIGAHSSAAKKIKKLQKKGGALNGLIFKDYSHMLEQFQPVQKKASALQPH